MISVFDVAAYILESKGEMTTMKLQKLCYYCQAWSLVWDEEPLFDEDIQAWLNGPVIPRLFYEHKGLYKITRARLDRGDSSLLSQTQLDTINAVLTYYGDRSAHWLIALTHSEDPWIEARRGVSQTDTRTTKGISLASMANYYSMLLDDADHGEEEAE